MHKHLRKSSQGGIIQTAILIASLLLPVALYGGSYNTTNVVIYNDERSQALAKFFQTKRSPLVPLAQDFVLAADKNGLDWRLLPGIAMVESSGGKHYKNRNIFGWKNGKAKFRSVRWSIHYLASRFAHSPLYAGKDVKGILRTYNSVRPEYAVRVLRFVRQLPGEQLLLADAVPARRASVPAIAFVAYSPNSACGESQSSVEVSVDAVSQSGASPLWEPQGRLELIAGTEHNTNNQWCNSRAASP